MYEKCIEMAHHFQPKSNQNSKRVTSFFVPLAFLVIVLVMVDDVVSLLEIGMRKQAFINLCVRNANHRHKAHQNSAAILQTCEDHWSTLLWIRLIILLVNICGNVSNTSSY
jgi:hypothetical protein